MHCEPAVSPTKDEYERVAREKRSRLRSREKQRVVGWGTDAPRRVDGARVACRRADVLCGSSPAKPQWLIPDEKRMQKHTHAGSGFAVAPPFHWHRSRNGQGRQLRMLAAYTMRRLPSARSSLFLGREQLPCWTTERPIGLER